MNDLRIKRRMGTLPLLCALSASLAFAACKTRTNSNNSQVASSPIFDSSSNVPFDIRKSPNVVNSNGEICGEFVVKNWPGFEIPAFITLNFTNEQMAVIPDSTDLNHQKTNFIVIVADKHTGTPADFKDDLQVLTRDIEELTARSGASMPHLFGCAKIGPTGAFWTSKFRSLPFLPATYIRITQNNGGPKTSQGCLEVQEPGKFGNPAPIDSGHVCCNSQWQLLGQRGSANNPCAAAPDSGHIYYKNELGGEPIYNAGNSPQCTYGQMSGNIRITNEENCFNQCAPNRAPGWQAAGLQHFDCFNNFCIGITPQQGQTIVDLGGGRSLRVCLY